MWDLVPLPGIKPGTLALGVQSLCVDGNTPGTASYFVMSQIHRDGRNVQMTLFHLPGFKYLLI